MYLDEIVAAQKRGEARGIPSVCSAHPYVIEQTLRAFEFPLIEATCNQVNQYGGYTGMTPKDFVAFVRSITESIHFPFENIILGGDHLGPSVWQNEPAESALQKSETLIHDYVQAGFTKIHLDCSMKLGGDPDEVLDVEVIAQRAARLARVAEQSLSSPHFVSIAQRATPLSARNTLRYIVGTEVPVPGGATQHEEGVNVTKIEDAQQTIEVTHEAFVKAGLESAWERVVGVVVQPGVEFGDDFVLQYQPEAARDLSKFIESQSLVYEAHSTDYQSREALKNLVRDHFAILKVGPALTFAFREGIFALAMIEDELFPADERSNLIQVLDDVMLKHPEHWKKYYQGDTKEQAFKRKFSFSDRIRYYWSDPNVQTAFERLLKNLSERPLPLSLLSQYLPRQYEKVRSGKIQNQPRSLLLDRIMNVLEDYAFACGRVDVKRH